MRPHSFPPERKKKPKIEFKFIPVVGGDLAFQWQIKIWTHNLLEHTLLIHAYFTPHTLEILSQLEVHGRTFSWNMDRALTRIIKF